MQLEEMIRMVVNLSNLIIWTSAVEFGCQIGTVKSDLVELGGN